MTWWMWLILVLAILGAIGSSKEKQQKEEAAKEALKRRTEAEDYIMKSGDQEAIKMLMLARANPANYNQVLAGSMNKGNDTVNTALGVMTGVAAGQLVANAITASAVSEALEKIQADLSSPSSDSIASSGSDSSSWSDDS